MADLKLRNRPICVGAKLPVLVEQALADILIVCLKHDSKCFRGVLLDTSKRNIPHGINLPLIGGLTEEKAHSKITGETVTVGRGQAHRAVNGEPDWSGLPLRHTYQQDITKLGGKFTDIAKRSTTRNFKDKTVRSIRLRPRQTLCSNCKVACHEQGSKNLSNKFNTKETTKNINDSTAFKPSSPHPSRPGLRDRRFQSKPHRIELRKRPLIPVVDTYPRVKLQRLDSSKFAKSPCSPVRKSESEPEDNFADRGPPEIEAAPPPLSAPPKVSPVIRISIGEGTVLKIPPRLHEIKESEGEFDDDDTVPDNPVHAHDLAADDSEVQLEMPILEMQGESSNYNTINKPDEIPVSEGDKNVELLEKVEHRKRKKALKKARSREKHRSLDSGSHSENTHPERHHKHKKKHKHRHNHETLERRPNPMVARSPLSSTSFTAEKQLCQSGENISPPDSDPEEEVVNKDRNERPRLLYRWRQKDGLPSLEPKNLIGDSDLHSNGESFMLHSKDKVHVDDNYECNSIKQSWSNYSSIQNSPREILSNYSSQSTVISEDKLECLSDMAPSDYEENEDSFPGNLTPNHDNNGHYDNSDNLDSFENFKPSLMMRIQTRSVLTCEMPDGRLITVGDIVWGKIQGFPWWPGRVVTISISQKDDGLIINQMAQVSWFGSSTMSHMQCSDLFPFLEDFNIRYNKKKRGPYKMAIKQATIASQNSMNGHQNIDLEDFDL